MISCRNLQTFPFTRPDLDIPVLLWTETLLNSVLAGAWHWMNQKLTTNSNHSKVFKGNTFACWNFQGCFFCVSQSSLLLISNICISILLSFDWVLIFSGKIQGQQALEVDSSFHCGQMQPKIQPVYSNSIKIWPGRTTTAEHLRIQRLVRHPRAATNLVAFLASYLRYLRSTCLMTLNITNRIRVFLASGWQSLSLQEHNFLQTATVNTNYH